VTITEKLDGGNCCLAWGKVYARTHGHEATHASFSAVKALSAQLRRDKADVFEVLDDRRIMLFGENMAAVHSIEYDGIGSVFYLFAALCLGLATSTSSAPLRWLSWAEVSSIAKALAIPTVPVVFQGTMHEPAQLESLLAQASTRPSALADPNGLPEAEQTRPEGFVVRHSASYFDGDGGHLMKYVRKGHVQTDASWKRTWRKARLNPDAVAALLEAEQGPHDGNSGHYGSSGGSGRNETGAGAAEEEVVVEAEGGEESVMPMAKFPRTPHIFDAGGGAVTRDDLLLGPTEVARFYSGVDVIIEEKVDGANLGISIGKHDYNLYYQNRSHFVCSTSASQWKGLASWERQHAHEIHSMLQPGRHILYGEWLAHQHSLDYDQLPSYFVAFDVYDKKVGRFWSRATLSAALQEHTTIPMVPPIYTGPVGGPEQLRALLNTSSAFRSGEGKYVEGVYLRIDDGGDNDPLGGSLNGTSHVSWLQLRAKLVRADFVQNINEGTHWTKTSARLNTLRW